MPPGLAGGIPLFALDPHPQERHPRKRRVAVGRLQLMRHLGHAAEHSQAAAKACDSYAVPDVTERKLADVEHLAMAAELVVLLLLDASEHGVAIAQGDSGL